MCAAQFQSDWRADRAPEGVSTLPYGAASRRLGVQVLRLLLRVGSLKHLRGAHYNSPMVWRRKKKKALVER